MAIVYAVDIIKLEASVCRDSFFDFVQRFWACVPELSNVDPIWNWHIKYLCDLVQETAERQFRGEKRKHDVLINIPPGSTKSTIFSVMFPAWTWTVKPSTRVICASYSHALALDLSRKCRDVITSEKYVRLFGIQLKVDQNTKSYFSNTQGGSRFSVGTDGTVTGFHGDFIVNDDPINPQEAISEQILREANRFSSETLSSRRTDKKVSVMFTVMQRLHQNDTSAVLLEKSSLKGGFKVKHVNFPAEVVGTGWDVVRPRKMAKHYRYTEGLLDPVRLSREILDGMRIEMGEYGYAAQMLLRPSPPGGGIFKTERILPDNPPDLRHFKAIVRYWDKAGTRREVRKTAARTAGVFMGLDQKGLYWILNVVKGQWDSSKREEIIVQTSQIDNSLIGKPRLYEVGVEQEPGSGGKESAEGTVRRLAGFKVFVDRPTGDKVTRADPFSVQVNAGNVRMAPGDWNREYLEELEFFPVAKFKDQVDASSGAFARLCKPRIRVGGRPL